MRLPSHTRAARHGFTLIEMLVVMFIIATLVGLITGAAIRVLARANEVRTASEIGQMSAAIDNMKASFKVKNPPSRIKLSETCNYPLATTPGTLDYDSVQYLTSMFPRIVLTAGTSIDWNGDGVITASPAGDYVLEGDQCLVFFLGGIPSTSGGVNGCTGFSTNPANPADSTAAFGRTPPFYDFKSSRLFVPNHTVLTPTGTPNFLAYKDGFNKEPYAYFSSYKTANGYNRYGATDCPSLGLSPYFEAVAPSTRYLRPDSFQIISAGADGTFGPGGLWAPAVASSVYPEGSAGADDLSNFSDRALGVNN
jgi:prepilin-type N-terminal cleavage/methylation domain-containing protein